MRQAPLREADSIWMAREKPAKSKSFLGSNVSLRTLKPTALKLEADTVLFSSSDLSLEEGRGRLVFSDLGKQWFSHFFPQEYWEPSNETFLEV